MDPRSAQMATIALFTSGTLFYIAMGFGLLSWQVGCFAGTACYLIGGMVRRMAALQHNDD